MLTKEDQVLDYGLIESQTPKLQRLCCLISLWVGWSQVLYKLPARFVTVWGDTTTFIATPGRSRQTLLHQHQYELALVECNRYPLLAPNDHLSSQLTLKLDPQHFPKQALPECLQHLVCCQPECHHFLLGTMTLLVEEAVSHPCEVLNYLYS
jgi:hypothetical protein